MIEPIMYFGIGFLIAGLLGLVLVPLVHNRAVRLTMKRIEAATPLSLAEIQADKDQLRAEFAMSTRRLELSVEQMKAKTAGQLAEIGKKTDAVNRLKLELADKTAAVFTLEAREKSLHDQLQTTETEHADKIEALREAERMLADRKAELAKLTADLDERSLHADSQRIEMVAMRTQVETLRGQIAEREKDAKEIGLRLDREREDATLAAAELADERNKADRLGDRVGELERALVVQTTESEIQTRRVEELEARHAEQVRILTHHEIESQQLRDKLAAADKTETELRDQIAADEHRHRTAIDAMKQSHGTALDAMQQSHRTAIQELEQRHRSITEAMEQQHRTTSDALKSEKVAVESEKLATNSELTRSQGALAKAQDEIASMKRDVDQSWAAERVENALLRERINDIAAEIARLTLALEGHNSPIETILATAPQSEPAVASASYKNGERRVAPGDGGSLADRIRALQTKASRVQPPN